MTQLVIEEFLSTPALREFIAGAELDLGDPKYRPRYVSREELKIELRRLRVVLVAREDKHKELQAWRDTHR